MPKQKKSPVFRIVKQTDYLPQGMRDLHKNHRETEEGYNVTYSVQKKVRYIFFTLWVEVELCSSLYEAKKSIRLMMNPHDKEIVYSIN
jgi:hypothetical protein